MAVVQEIVSISALAQASSTSLGRSLSEILIFTSLISMAETLEFTEHTQFVIL